MPEVDETILEKIRKVAGYTTSSNPNEAAVAAAKLSAMLLKYNLDASQIPHKAKDTNQFKRETSIYKMLPEWHIDLAIAVAKANLCKVVISGSNLVWLGREHNLEVAKYIFDYVRGDLERLAELFWYAVKFAASGDPTMKLPHGRVWKQGFYRGAVDAIRTRLLAELQEQRVDTNMNALIVRNDSELKEYVHSQFPSLGFRTARNVGNHLGGYAAGQAAGNSVQFRGGIGSGGSESQRRLGSGS